MTFMITSVSNTATAWSSVPQAGQALSIRARNKGDRPLLTLKHNPTPVYDSALKNSAVPSQARPRLHSAPCGDPEYRLMLPM
jgi:hypothetical protein